MANNVYLGGNIPGLRLIHQGKVRDLFQVSRGLLLVTTDRISAFDVVFKEGIPGKGRVLTAVSVHWFDRTKQLFPNHLLTANVDEIPEIPASHRDLLRGRVMLGKKSEVFPFEFIVRGYLSGSGWSDYKKSGAICGITLPQGLQESSKLPEPILTPTTKEKTGHDLPVEFSAVEKAIGRDTAKRLHEAAISLYKFAAQEAEKKGVLIADTKFEFGICDGQLLVLDEVLTPDSSRYWPMDEYKVGRGQPSYDKQIVRDYLNTTSWNKTPPPPPLPEEIVRKTSARYQELCERLTGRKA